MIKERERESMEDRVDENIDLNREEKIINLQSKSERKKEEMITLKSERKSEQREEKNISISISNQH